MRIRKFNESLETIDMNYIDECFVDIADNYQYDSKNYKTSIYISVGMEDKYTTPFFSSISAEDMIEILEWKINIIREIRYCLDKVKIKYPDLLYIIDFKEHDNMDEGTGEINIILQDNKNYGIKL